MKAGTTSKIKFARLMERAGIDRCMAVGLLESLWMLTAENAPAGDIGRFTDIAIADGLGIPPDRWEALRDALIETKWLDRSEAHRLVIHDWESHCGRLVKMRLARSGTPFAHAARAHGARTKCAHTARAQSAHHNDAPPARCLGIREGIKSSSEGEYSQIPNTDPSSQKPNKTVRAKKEWSGEVRAESRAEIAALWNASRPQGTRKASAVDCGWLNDTLFDIAACAELADAERADPVAFLRSRIAAYLASDEARRERGKFCTSLRNFLKNRKYLEDPEAWAARDAGPDPVEEQIARLNGEHPA